MKKTFIMSVSIFLMAGFGLASAQPPEEIEAITPDMMMPMESATPTAPALPETAESKKLATENGPADPIEARYRGCAACHGMNGEMKAMGKAPVLAGQSKEDLAAKITGYMNGSYGGEMKAVMQGQMKNFPEEDIEAMAEYISKL